MNQHCIIYNLFIPIPSLLIGAYTSDLAIELYIPMFSSPPPPLSVIAIIEKDYSSVRVRTSSEYSNIFITIVLNTVHVSYLVRCPTRIISYYFSATPIIYFI